MGHSHWVGEALTAGWWAAMFVAATLTVGVATGGGRCTLLLGAERASGQLFSASTSRVLSTATMRLSESTCTTRGRWVANSSFVNWA